MIVLFSVKDELALVLVKNIENGNSNLTQTQLNSYSVDLLTQTLKSHSKWFEPRSISSSCVMIVWVGVVLKRTVVGD